MSQLRQRMDEAMVLRGLAERARATYLMCVTGLAKYYRRSPEQLDAAQSLPTASHHREEVRLRQRQSTALAQA